MSVLIKGMEMPERCGMCFLRVGDCKQRIYMEQRPKDCPLIEIPTPHGRLIDADELANKTFYSVTSAPYITYKKFVDAPTVIEAEGSKE